MSAIYRLAIFAAMLAGIWLPQYRTEAVWSIVAASLMLLVEGVRKGMADRDEAKDETVTASHKVETMYSSNDDAS